MENKAIIIVSVIAVLLVGAVVALNLNTGDNGGITGAASSNQYYCCGISTNLKITTSCSDTSGAWNKWGWKQTDSCYKTSCNSWCVGKGYSSGGEVSGDQTQCSCKLGTPCPEVNMQHQTVDLRDAGGNYGERSSQQVIAIHLNTTDGLKINRARLNGTEGYISSDVKTDEIYIMFNRTPENPLFEVFYINSDNDVAIAGNTTSLIDFAYVTGRTNCRVFPQVLKTG